ncbi:hypothetical protein DNTS_022693 [Danionella cerebrum]|uniref:NAD-dependent protein deacetylase sirtuin-2 n=1 Tax=Danionella cerebrum TaxID=2873325 RepID=A0A553MXX9_9TELE|nr:hypothetical protein DNTS_022693 [Danionella translucida]
MLYTEQDKQNGQSEWFDLSLWKKFKKSQYRDIEGVNMSGTLISFKNFYKLEGLKNIKTLSLRGCPEVDDWVLARLHVFKNSLLELDLSHCSRVTSGGLPALQHLRNLQRLDITGLTQLENRGLVKILVEDMLPRCEGQSDSSDEADASGDTEMDFLRSLFSRTLGLSPGEKILDELTLDGVAQYILSGKSAGIPDFRSPGTGLYANLQKYNLPYPEAIFQIDYFKKHPEPFFALARELYPGQFKPTVCHYFIKLLKDKGLLRRCYSQNIDTLERVAGLDGEDLVEAHGTFHTSHCISFLCRKEYTMDWMKNKIFSENIPKCDSCGSLVKPDIVFFGESLPSRFFTSMKMDFPLCDLLIIMGTSLQVQPFASLVSRVSSSCPRLLINMEKTGQSEFGMGLDVAHLSTCDDGCMAFAELLGWKEELDEMVKQEHALIDGKDVKQKDKEANQSLKRTGEEKTEKTE